MPIGINIDAAKNATDIARKLMASPEILENAHLKLEISKIIEELVEVRMQIVENKELIGSKSARIAELESALENKATLIKGGDAYFDSAGSTISPFCLRCWECDYKKVHLTHKATCRTIWICPSCNHEVSHNGVLYPNRPRTQ